MDDISEEEQHFIFELIERRHDDAILDRIVHNAIFVETGSMNMREYCAKLHR